MRTTPELQAIVSEIAAKHGLDLDRAGAYLRLWLEAHGELVIENIGGDGPGTRISVTNYIPVGNDKVADPQVVVYAGYAAENAHRGQERHVWVPIEYNELFGGWRLYAEMDESGELMLYDAAGQAELARYCERTVARNLRRDGWLEFGRRCNLPVPVWTEAEMRARDIRYEEAAFSDEEDGDVPF